MHRPFLRPAASKLRGWFQELYPEIQYLVSASLLEEVRTKSGERQESSNQWSMEYSENKTPESMRTPIDDQVLDEQTPERGSLTASS
jgi:hypothetical protein